MRVRPGGRALLAIADADKPEMLAIASGLARLGCRIYATAGTAAALRTAGFSPEVVGKLGDAGPTAVGLIAEGLVDLVINTTAGPTDEARTGMARLGDGARIRRSAVEWHVPCLTSLDTAAALIESAASGGTGLEVRTITEWRDGSRGEPAGASQASEERSRPQRVVE
jgi:carbamoyl-phosphate synthase large subunit